MYSVRIESAAYIFISIVGITYSPDQKLFQKEILKCTNDYHMCM